MAYYTPTLVQRHTVARAEDPNREYNAIATAFNRLPEPELIQQGRTTYVVATGPANTYAGGLVPALTSYEEGLTLTVKIPATNTGASTINIDGLGARQILRADGSAQIAGQLLEGGIVTMTYDGSLFLLREGYSVNVTATDGAVGIGYFGVGPSTPLITTSMVSSMVDYCTTTGLPIYVPPGEYETEPFQVGSASLSLYGDRLRRPTFRLRPGADTNCVGTSGSARLVLSDLIFDHNGALQANGHGLRSGGCSQFHLTRVKVLNATDYGIGFQAGSARGVVLSDVEVDGSGSDGIDIKDKEFGNDYIVVDGYTFSNIARAGTSEALEDCGLDLRGPVQVRRVRGFVQSAQSGVRQRGPDDTNGRGATGTASDIAIKGLPVNGNSSTGCFGLFLEGGIGFTVNNVFGLDVGAVVGQHAISTGSLVSGITGTGLRGTGISIAGDGAMLSDIAISNHPSAPLILDVQPSADDAMISNFRLVNLSGSANPVRISAGATNTRLSNGIIKNGTVSNAGTGTVQTNVSAL